MAKTLNIIQGVVKYAAGPARETKNGPRINVVITLPSGEDIKLWGDPGDAVLTPLRKGNLVQRRLLRLFPRQSPRRSEIAPGSKRPGGPGRNRKRRSWQRR
jgi:hypothetical protein